MKRMNQQIVVDGQARIERSEAYEVRKNEILRMLVEENRVHMDSIGRFRKWLKIKSLKRKAERMAREEMCPKGGLYLSSPFDFAFRTRRERQ